MSIRQLLQPGLPVSAPTQVTLTLSASYVAHPTCPHMFRISVQATPAGAIVELADSGTWTQIPYGTSSPVVTDIIKSVAVAPPSRSTGLYTYAAKTLTIRARPAPGTYGDSIISVITLPTSTPGAYVSGVAGFTATKSGTGSGVTYNIAIRPGGFAHEVRATDFTKFTGTARLYLYKGKPTQVTGVLPVAHWISEPVPLTISSGPTTTFIATGIPAPDLAGSLYATVTAAWASVDCSRCADGTPAYPVINSYPIILPVP